MEEISFENEYKIRYKIGYEYLYRMKKEITKNYKFLKDDIPETSQNLGK